MSASFQIQSPVIEGGKHAEFGPEKRVRDERIQGSNLATIHQSTCLESRKVHILKTLYRNI